MSTRALDTFKEASEALYEGDSDRAAALMVQGAAAAGAVDLDAVEQAIDERSRQRRAVDKLLVDYPEIANDPDMQALADQRVDVLMRGGQRVEDAVAAAGDQLGEKFRLGKYRVARDRGSNRGQTDQVQDDPQAAVARDGMEFLRQSRFGTPS